MIRAIILSLSLCACSSPKTESGAMLSSPKIGQALDVIQRAPSVYEAVTKYRIELIDGLEYCGIAYLDQKLMTLDYSCVNSISQKNLVNLICHEAGHLELGHRYGSPENEDAAIAWQLEAIKLLYPED